jgi:hypothetical protein
MDFSDEDGDADGECEDGETDGECEDGGAAERVVVADGIGSPVADGLVDTTFACTVGTWDAAGGLVETAVGRTVGDRVVLDAGAGGSPLA